ncbi:hypothetical protein [Xanthomonas arboricola]|uniref:hypothetical protein n=1 Tax=Xanthomonas arboricola TaxID=56448 RepID=UPI0011B08B4A|nr:hypothetical protein [Xanthomonas arboricola]
MLLAIWRQDGSRQTLMLIVVEARDRARRANSKADKLFREMAQRKRDGAQRMESTMTNQPKAGEFFI